ncbi:MAG: diacylglycerol kinase family protein [Bacteroidota bacterium]
MNNNKNLGLRSRTNSFGYAIRGLAQIFREEPNVKLHAIATVVAIAAGLIRHISKTEWIAIIIAIGLVWITETLNTCIERLCDFACNRQLHPEIKIIKDIAAGAVLLAAVVSVTIGIIVFFI